MRQIMNSNEDIYEEEVENLRRQLHNSFSCDFVVSTTKHRLKIG